MNTNRQDHLLLNARALIARRLDPLVGSPGDNNEERIEIRDGKLVLPPLDLLDALNLANALTEYLPYAG